MTGILFFLLMLGVLIFVHELGHFMAAKACGIYVDRFSLGFPPRLFGIKWGDTDYCVGLLPLGGYVKMAGQEDLPQSDDKRESAYGHVPPEQWFNNRPKWQRGITLFAGPAMNLLFGFVLYAFIAGVGQEVPLSQVDNRVGVIEEDSPASTAPLYLAAPGTETPDFSSPPDEEGLKTGDRILIINGKKVTGIIEDVAIEAVLNAGRISLLEIEREGPGGVASRYLSPIEPKILDDTGLARFGIAPFRTALIGRVLPESPAKARGLRKGDMIIRAGGEAVDSATFSRKVRNLPAGTTLQLDIERDGQIIQVTLDTKSTNRIEGLSFTPPLNPLLRFEGEKGPIIVLDNGEFRKATGFALGDVVTAVNGEPATGRLLQTLFESPPSKSFEVTVERTQKGFGLIRRGGVYTLNTTAAQLLRGLVRFEAERIPEIAAVTLEVASATGLQRQDTIIEIDGQPATMALLRETGETRVGETIPIKVAHPEIAFGLVQTKEIFDAEMTVGTSEVIGVVFDTKMVFRRATAGEILPQAWRESYRVTAQIGTVLNRLISGGLSPKNALGGPVMIYEISTHAARTNLAAFLDIMAMISINLGLLNLLPLPVLDGGQLVFLGIEAIRRKPVSIRIMEVVQQVGVVLLIGFMAYVTFNDVSRLFSRLIP